MKRVIRNVVMASLSVMLISSCGPSRVAVRTRPVAPVVVRPVAPYPNAYWMDGEWMWRGGNYVYVQPHFVTPRRGYKWSPGYWKPSRRGDVWIKGRWRR